jgi:hypothetical protein
MEMSEELAAKDAALKREREQLAEKDAALKRERAKTDRTYEKLLKNGQNKLPDLDGSPTKGYDSAIEFQARSEESAWTPLQQMGHLQQQSTVVDGDGKEVAREGEHWGVAVETLDTPRTGRRRAATHLPQCIRGLTYIL